MQPNIRSKITGTNHVQLAAGAEAEASDVPPTRVCLNDEEIEGYVHYIRRDAFPTHPFFQYEEDDSVTGHVGGHRWIWWRSQDEIQAHVSNCLKCAMRIQSAQD